MNEFSSPPRSLLIVGASARAAAQSANAAGYNCFAIDLFSDVDTRACCKESVKVDRLEDAISAAGQFPAEALIYTGVMENRPDLLSQLSDQFPLAGNGIGTISKVRDPFWMQQLANENGFRFPPTLRYGNAASFPGEAWLSKPFSSGSGWGISTYSRDAEDPRKNPEHYYLQKRVQGIACSAAFVSGMHTTSLIGVSQQIQSSNQSSTEQFHYRGSIAPFEIAPTTLEEILRIGEIIAREANMRGLFGIDFVLSGDSVHIIEINPRYTASMELFEATGSGNLIQQHLRACAGMQWDGDSLNELAGEAGSIGCKRIEFSQEQTPFTVSDDFLPWAEQLPATMGRILDIPPAGTRISFAEPVFSAITLGESIEQSLMDCDRLVRQANQVVMGKQISAK